MLFSKISLTDDASIASMDEGFIKNLGNIKVTGHRVLAGAKTTPTLVGPDFSDRVSFATRSSALDDLR
jgi:hypothetical protein